MWQDVVTLFTEMQPIPAILLAVGIVLCIIEMFQPGIGFFGISGSISILAGIILRFVYGFNLGQLFVLILIIAVILAIAGILIIRSIKKGLLSKSALINNKTSVPVEFQNAELQSLVGESGLTTTECKPVGKARINNNEYEVISGGEYLNKETEIQVTKIDGNNIIIKAKQGEENIND